MPPRNIFLVQSSYPGSYDEAAGNPFWKSTLKEDYNSLLKNQTWDLAPLPLGKKFSGAYGSIGTREKTDGHVSRYKSSLVSKGSQKVHYIDYDETFSLVVKMDSIRLELAIDATKG
jgi:hypothetical protein